MPTTVYDASLITYRKNFGLIAKSVQTRNQAGVPIMNASPTGNTTVDQYQVQLGDTIGLCCVQLCPALSGSSVTPDQHYSVIMTHFVADPLTPAIIGLIGSGTIYWGDGSSETFKTGLSGETLSHSYASSGTYEIKIGSSVTLIATYPYVDSGINFFSVNLDLRTIDILDLPMLETLVVSNPTLVSLSGLEKCISLKELFIGFNSVSYAGIKQLQNFIRISLNNRPDISGTYDCSANLVSTLERLYINNNSLLTELSNLESLPNIATLFINDCGFSGIFEIPTSLSNTLTEFSCFNNSITDISGLQTCKNMTSLACYNCYISGVLNVTDLSGLKFLFCNDNPITGLSGLQTCTSLETLNCYSCGISGELNVTDLSGLQTLNCYSNTNLTGISGLQTCTNLIELQCNNCDISGVLNVTDLSGLQTLSCYSNPNLTGLSGLQTCTNLTVLQCFECGISGELNVSGLSGLQFIDCINNPNLTSLFCYNCDISGELNVTDLSELQLLFCFGNNQLTNIYGLQTCSSLIILTCDSCNINGILNVTDLSRLTNLVCSDNTYLTGLSGLQTCSSLTILNCSNCSISGELNVSGLSTLQSLNCINNPITGISGLQTCTSLSYLNCYDSSIDITNADIIAQGLVNAGINNGYLYISNVDTTINIIVRAHIDRQQIIPGTVWYTLVNPPRNWTINT